MFNLKLKDGSPNLNIPDKMKFDVMESYLKSLGIATYQNPVEYNTALDLVEAHTGNVMEAAFPYAICLIFLKNRFSTPIETLVDLLMDDKLIGYCYNKFIEDGGLN